MDTQNLLTRVIAAGLPLVIIALVFGAIGYALEEPETTPIPPLAEREAGVKGARGEVTDVSGNDFTLVAEDGSPLDYTLSPGATFEVLEPITLADISEGDWLNGGAIPHAQTVLALVNLILVTEPVPPP